MRRFLALLVIALFVLMGAALSGAGASTDRAAKDDDGGRGVAYSEYGPGSDLAVVVTCQAHGGSCGYERVPLTYDSLGHLAMDLSVHRGATKAVAASTAGVGAQDVVSPRHVYDSSDSFVAPSGLLDNFADVGSGASLIRRVDVDGGPVSIKSGHGYRPDHGSVDITGVLGRDAVDSAVATDLATRVNAGTSVTRAGRGHSTFQTVVGGHTVEYRSVFVPATGRYEVGTYYIP